MSETNHSFIDWQSEQVRNPPPFQWIIPHWLSAHPTLLAGAGGMGKSFMAQTIATSLVSGVEYIGVPDHPTKVLIWACEDDQDEIARRQVTINRHLGTDHSDLQDLLYIDVRRGLDSTLYSTDFGKLEPQAPLFLLREQINDQQIDVVFIDNISQSFGGNENDRHHVTHFINSVIGLRPALCAVFLGHLAKSANSEYSGSTAWENAVRMRWFLGNKLPDQKPDEDQEAATDELYLAKRKTNYTSRDWIRFQLVNGIAIPDKPEGSGNGSGDLYNALKHKKCLATVLDAIAELSKRNIHGSKEFSSYYLPKLITEYNLSQGFSRKELDRSMKELIMSGQIKESEIGKNSAYRPIIRLVLS